MMKNIVLDKKQMKFCNENNLIIREKNQLVLMYSKKNKKHVFQSKEVYDYITEAINEKIDYEDFIELFSENDKEYMKQLIDNMVKAGIIYIGEENENINVNELNIKSIYLTMTSRCNLTCKHCCTNCSPSEKDILTTENIMTIIDTIMTMNPSEVILTGGEPLLRKDFKEIVEYIKFISNGNVNLILSTNGTLISQDNIDFIVDNFERVEISIDGVDEDTCSSIRGKGVFEKIISNILKLQGKRFYNIRTSMVFGDKNEHLTERFEDLNKSLGTRSIKRAFFPVGRGRENINDFLSEGTTIPVALTQFDENKDRKELNSCSCDLYKDKIIVDSDGKLYPCPSLMKDKYSLGSILDKNIKSEIIRFRSGVTKVNGEVEKIYPYSNEKCVNCDVNIFCIHCPALIDLFIENQIGFEEWCETMKPKINNIIWEGGI